MWLGWGRGCWLDTAKCETRGDEGNGRKTRIFQQLRRKGRRRPKKHISNREPWISQRIAIKRIRIDWMHKFFCNIHVAKWWFLLHLFNLCFTSVHRWLVWRYFCLLMPKIVARSFWRIWQKKYFQSWSKYVVSASHAWAISWNSHVVRIKDRRKNSYWEEYED